MPLYYTTLICHWLTTVDSRPSHTSGHIHHRQATVEGDSREGERVELGGGVMSRCRIVFWTWVIFQRGKGGHLVSLPLWPPPFLGDVSTFHENQHGPVYVRGSSNKIYRWGHKTPFVRGERDMCCRTHQTINIWCCFHAWVTQCALQKISLWLNHICSNW